MVINLQIHRKVRCGSANQVYRSTGHCIGSL